MEPTEQQKKELDIAGLEINTCYLMTQAIDTILRDCERRHANLGMPLKHEVKQKFSRWAEAVKKACILSEDLCQDIYKHEEKRNYKDVQIWQEQWNECARFNLMLADISRYVDYVNEVFGHLRSFKGDGIITEEVLKNFYLKKL